MPAAAVIPAPIAYIRVVAVKKLVVGFLALRKHSPSWHEPRVLAFDVDLFAFSVIHRF